MARFDVPIMWQRFAVPCPPSYSESSGSQEMSPTVTATTALGGSGGGTGNFAMWVLWAQPTNRSKTSAGVALGGFVLINDLLLFSRMVLLVALISTTGKTAPPSHIMQEMSDRAGKAIRDRASDLFAWHFEKLKKDYGTS